MVAMRSRQTVIGPTYASPSTEPVFCPAVSAGFFLLNAAYAVYTASAAFKDILYLRITLLVATFLYMVYGIVDPNWSVFFWNIPVAVLHTWGIWQLQRNRRGIDLDDEAEAIRTLIFPDLDRMSFNILWHLGEERSLAGGEVLLVKDEPVEELSLILDGEVNVDAAKGLRVLSQYRIIGEISSLTGGTSSATVTTQGDVRLRAWNKQALTTCSDKHPDIQVALLRAMGHEAARKVI